MVLNNGEATNYGFGWSIGEGYVGHTGSMNGFRTFMRRYTDTGSLIVMLTNNGDAVGANDIIGGLETILAGEPLTYPDFSEGS